MTKQTIIPGTVDDAPPIVSQAAAKYLEHKRATADQRAKMNGALEDLIEKMQENDCTEILIDGGEKKLILEEEAVVKIKARKKGKGGEWEED